MLYERSDKIFKYKGKRIRASNRSLVYHTALTGFSFIFLLVLLPFHVSSLMTLDWQTVTMDNLIQQLHRPYFWGSVITALFVCLLIGFLYYRYRIDSVKQLQHRQKLARMVLQNGWYEAEQIQDDGFFKDLPSSKTKEKIRHFPKLYYYLKDGLIHINVEITMGKYQDQLLQLEKKLETGLFCELVDKELKESYIEYTLLYDTIASRITIDEVVAKDGRLKLMNNVYWAYDSLPHMLIAGGTGGGKTYFILTLIEALLHTDSKLYVLDPKNADLADLETIMDNVYYRKDDMLACIEQFYEDMLARSEEMKRDPNYKTGENYAYLGLPANFLIFDEYVAFMGANRFPTSIE
ncbi:ATP-binding protein [Listeria monocytogenes]|nr:ATP-binding protein [Listeria monocytogenes]MCM64585.1 ATP-binding protein [Listeria monocytogenes]